MDAALVSGNLEALAGKSWTYHRVHRDLEHVDEDVLVQHVPLQRPGYECTESHEVCSYLMSKREREEAVIFGLRRCTPQSQCAGPLGPLYPNLAGGFHLAAEI